TPTANGCLVQNMDLGGFTNRISAQDIGGTKIAWLVTSNFPNGFIQAFDLETKCLWPAPITPSSQVIVDAAPCPDGSPVVADQTASANGLRVYQGAAELTTAPLAIGLAPGSTHGLTCF